MPQARTQQEEGVRLGLFPAILCAEHEPPVSGIAAVPGVPDELVMSGQSGHLTLEDNPSDIVRTKTADTLAQTHRFTG